MKRLIFILAAFVCLNSFGQREFDTRTITVPTGADTTVSHLFYSDHNTWSSEFNSTDVDGVDTLYVYCTAFADSATDAGLIWVDQDLDGVNDNPWTLSTTINLFIWGESFPCRYIVYRLAKGTSTPGTIHQYYETKR